MAHAIAQALPGESIVYFGDTAHLPYGDKSPDSIKYYSIRIAQFLLHKKCKAIVIACNTASSIASETVRDFAGKKIPVIDVISPAVERITLLKKISKVGVIGTKGTIRSDVYAKKIHQQKPGIEVVSLATPLLAPMIEEGFFNNKISRTIIGSYLLRPKLKNINVLILGCTHYPLIRPEVEEIYGGKTPVLDSAEIVAAEVKRTLTRKKMLASGRKGTHHFYVSDYTQSFEKTTGVFFGNQIRLEEARIWK